MRYYSIQNEVKAYINRLNRDNISVTTDDLKTINDHVILLKKSGVWSKFSLGFNDIDADSYCVRAGVTNLLGRCEVIWFAKGVKAMGLWNSMVSWPMRNYQNASTGSTVYSLGGFGIHNGTMVGGPVWNTDKSGIKFSALSVRQYMNVPTLTQTFNSNVTNIFAANLTTYTSSVPRLIGMVDAPASELTLKPAINNTITGLETWSEGTYSSMVISPVLSMNNMYTYGVTFNYQTNTLNYLVNNTLTTSSRAASNPGVRSFQIGAGQQLSNHFSGDIAYGIRFYTNLNQIQMLSVKTLASSTIGKDLGLP